eukprot:5834155-Amphidinium_carterae.1
MVSRGWAVEYRSFDELAAQHGGLQHGVPLNKLGLISKERPDSSVKHRLIWDLRRSGVNGEQDPAQRIVLP